jgi:hypothetical protein
VQAPVVDGLVDLVVLQDALLEVLDSLQQQQQQQLLICDSSSSQN